MVSKQKCTYPPPPKSTIFDDVYRTIVQKLSFLIIPAINEAFGTHYDMRTDITQLRNEHLELAGKIITDSIFRIGKMLYHIECQSTPDGTIVLRMFEYGFAIALEAACKGKAPYRIRFPLSAVIYLRPDPKVDGALSMEVEFPNGQTITYKVPVISVQDCSLDYIFEKQLWLFIPFYIMRFQKDFKQMEKDREKRKSMLEELSKMDARLVEHTDKANLPGLYSNLMKFAQNVADHILKQQPKTKKEVRKIMGGKILELHTEKVLKKGKREGRKEGREEGRKEERQDGIIALIATAKDFSASPAQAVEQLKKRYSLSEAEAQAAVKANW